LIKDTTLIPLEKEQLYEWIENVLLPRLEAVTPSVLSIKDALKFLLAFPQSKYELLSN